MASLLLGTTIGGFTAIHSNNISSQSVNYATSAGNASTVSSITGNTGLMINRLTPTSFIDGLTTSTFRSSLFNTTSNGAAISAARWNSVPAPLSGMNMYGTMIAWSGDSDTHGFVATDYAAPIIKVGGGYGNIIAWTATLIHSENIGSQSVNYATTAGSVSGGLTTSNYASTLDGRYFFDFGFTIGYPGTDANNMPGNRSAFTYSNGAPYTGPIAHFGAAGYGLQLNANYGTGTLLGFRVRNGDNGTWNAWREIIHSGNIASQSVSYADESGYSASTGTTDNIGGVQFRNTGSNAGTNADTIDSNGITYYTSGVSNFSGNATDGALYSQRYSTSWQHQIAGDYRSGMIAVRGRNNGTWTSWRTIIDSSTIGSQSVNYASSAGSAVNLSGLGIIQSTSTGTSYQNNYQVRENAGGGSNTNEIYAPQLAFHWSGVVASSIMMESSGRIAIRNNPGGSYENFIANGIYGSIFYDSGNSNYYVDPNSTTSGYFAGVLRQNDGKYVRDAHYRTISGYGDLFSGGSAGWTTIAEITLAYNCGGAVLYGTLFDHRYDGADAYQLSIVARSDCDFTSNNSSHYINVGCTITGSTAIGNYRDKIRVLLVYAPDGARTYELQVYETAWNHNTWQLESNGWTIYTSAQSARTGLDGAKVNYISNQNADYQMANEAMYSPIYYDSNNTNFYLDPNGSSVLNGTVVIKGNDNQLAIDGTTGALASGLFFRESGNNKYELYHYNGEFRFYNYTTNQQELSINNVGGFVTARTSFRAPIFYDSNDTNYYIDPNGISVLAGFNLNSAGTAKFRYLAPGEGTVNISAPFALNSSTGAINIAMTDNDTGGVVIDNEGVTVYGAGDTGIVFRVIDEDVWQTNGNNVDAATTFRVIQGADGGALTRGTHTATNDFRAPTFYDSQDTNYFIDPNGSSQISTIYANNWFRAQNATGLYFSSYGRGIWSADSAGSSYGNVSIYGEGVNSWPGYAINSLACFMARDIRRGIFIPSADSWLIRYESGDGMAHVDFELQWGSDIRHKSNIKRISRALDKVKQLKGVTYNYKGNERTSIGFIAQEVEPVLPEVVSTDGDGFKSVGYANIVALLSEAIKEQQVMIDELRAEIDALKSK